MSSPVAKASQNVVMKSLWWLGLLQEKSEVDGIQRCAAERWSSQGMNMRKLSIPQVMVGQTYLSISIFITSIASSGSLAMFLCVRSTVTPGC